MSFFKKIFGLGKKSAPAPKKPSATLLQLMGSSGKIPLLKLLPIADTYTLQEFTAFIRAPVLAGEAIQQGTIADKSANKDKNKSTLMFMQAGEELEDNLVSETLRAAIYPLVKLHKHETQNESVSFTIGRIDGNHIVMPDFAVSEQHALIQVKQGVYELKDVGSTNGTSINGKKIEVDKPIILQDGDVVSLGRYEFTFLFPERLYARLREEKTE